MVVKLVLVFGDDVGEFAFLSFRNFKAASFCFKSSR